MVVSVVLPVFRNADTLVELTDRIQKAVISAGYGCEIVCVNDDCPDRSFAVLEKLALRIPHFTAIDLIRNVGQHQAVLTGMAFARGDWIAVMDADLQDSPDALPLLLDRARKQNAVVFAGRRGLYESRARLASSRVFKTLLSIAAQVPRDAGMFFVVSREVKDRLLKLQIRSPYVVAMLGAVADRIVSCPVERSARSRGKSSYSVFTRLLSGLRAIECALRCRFEPARSGSENNDNAIRIRSVLRGPESRLYSAEENR